MKSKDVLAAVQSHFLVWEGVGGFCFWGGVGGVSSCGCSVAKEEEEARRCQVGPDLRSFFVGKVSMLDFRGPPPGGGREGPPGGGCGFALFLLFYCCSPELPHLDSEMAVGKGGGGKPKQNSFHIKPFLGG